ncbi:MAG: O-antigen ligase family protein [Anaerolineales bacterium]|nr:O-antigen ligase family protein [Anaerolineales bacterium]
MLTRWYPTSNNKTWLLEGIVLAGSLPFLLFPNRYFVATFLALLGLVFIETIPVLARWRPWPTPTTIDILLLLFSLTLGLAIFVSADPDLTLDKATGVLLGLFSLRYLLRTIDNPNFWYLAFIFFGLMGLGFVLLGILNASWLTKIPLLTPVIERLPNQIISVPGQPDSGIHPNQIAGTLIFYFPLAWAGWFGQPKQNGRFLKSLWLALSLAATGALFLTQSRSGWLGGAAALYILVALWALSLPQKTPQRRHLFILLGVITLAGFGLLMAIGPDRLVALWQDPAQETAVGSLGSLGFRQEMWRWAIVVIQDFSFTGVGLGSFRRVVRRLYPLGIDPGYDVAHAHNIFLHTAVDIGIPGLIIYLALIGLVLVLGWQAAKTNARMRPYALGLTAGLAAFHIYGLGDVLALGSKTGLAFWFLIGLILTLQQISQSTASTEGTPPSPLANHSPNPS